MLFLLYFALAALFAIINCVPLYLDHLARELRKCFPDWICSVRCFTSWRSTLDFAVIETMPTVPPAPAASMGAGTQVLWAMSPLGAAVVEMLSGNW